MLPVLHELKRSSAHPSRATATDQVVVEFQGAAKVSNQAFSLQVIVHPLPVEMNQFAVIFRTAMISCGP